MFFRSLHRLFPRHLIVSPVTAPPHRHHLARKMATTAGNGPGNRGVSLSDLPKSHTFTSKLPPDPAFETPESSHNAPREALGPRLVKGALYTYVRPEPSSEPELLSVSPRALADIGLKEGEEKTREFQDLVAGNKIFWDENTKEGVYPWAQCYGGETLCLFTYILLTLEKMKRKYYHIGNE